MLLETLFDLGSKEDVIVSVNTFSFILSHVICNQLYRLRFAHQFLAQMLEAKVS